MHYNQRRKAGAEVVDSVKGVTCGFGLQVITTFEAAFAFTLGLLTHELIKEWSESWKYSKSTSWILFMCIAFILPHIRHIVANWGGRVDDSEVVKDTAMAPMPIGTIEPKVNSHGFGSSHSSMYHA